MNAQDRAMYRDQFENHMAAGDDAMNAELRIVEEGCPLDVAKGIAAEADAECPEDDDAGE